MHSDWQWTVPWRYARCAMHRRGRVLSARGGWFEERGIKVDYVDFSISRAGFGRWQAAVAVPHPN